MFSENVHERNISVGRVKVRSFRTSGLTELIVFEREEKEETAAPLITSSLHHGI